MSRNVVVWGWGRHGGGAAAVRFCLARGDAVVVLDREPRVAFNAPTDLSWLQGDGTHPGLRSADLIIASPAIPPRAIPADLAVPVLPPEALFFAAHTAPVAAVTGTKGKSTTAAILGALLGWPVGGNSYEPLLDLLAKHGPDVPVVAELSSFQLWHLRQVRPQVAVAVVTSLAVDHLDWHPHLAHYHDSKLALTEWAGAVAAAPELHARLVGRPLLPLVTCSAGIFRDGTRELARRTDLAVLGEHNARNACLAIAAALHLGCPRAQVAPRLRTVRALPHRLQVVRDRDGLRGIDDSIATTPEAAMAGLLAVDGPVAVILGGSDKGADFTALAAAVRERGALPVVFGSTGPRITVALAMVGVQPRQAGSLAEAVALAITALGGQGTVLLSPACASFDMFRGFEDRGRQFQTLVQGWGLSGATPGP